MSSLFRVAIDGPAASGKSSTAKLLAKRLGFGYIDSGAMFRAITLQCLEKGICPSDPSNEHAIGQVAKRATIRFPSIGQVELDGRNVSDLIRTSTIVRNISHIASNPTVRATLAEQQRALARGDAGLRSDGVGGMVMDGRDIGTVILPDAELKIFLIADARVRAERRHREMMAQQQRDGGTVPVESLEAIARDIEARDLADRTRTISPLKKANDAVELDTSQCTIEEQVQIIETIVRERMARR